MYKVFSFQILSSRCIELSENMLHGLRSRREDDKLAIHITTNSFANRNKQILLQFF